MGAADTTSLRQNYYICMFLYCNLFYVIYFTSHGVCLKTADRTADHPRTVRKTADYRRTQRRTWQEWQQNRRTTVYV